MYKRKPDYVNPKATYHFEDIRKENVLAKHLRDVDVIVHTGAQVAVTRSMKDPRTDFEINPVGTFNVLEGARRSGSDPAIVFCSMNKIVNSVIGRHTVVRPANRNLPKGQRLIVGENSSLHL